MVGTGVFAELLRRRFDLAARRLGLKDSEDRYDLRTDLFRPPVASGSGAQLTLGL